MLSLVSDILGERSRGKVLLAALPAGRPLNGQPSPKMASQLPQPIQCALKEKRGVINYIRSRLVAVSKDLEKRPS
jgi:hypothetical protein